MHEGHARCSVFGERRIDARPGGQEVFEDASGAVWMAYHAWTAPKTSYGAGGARSLRLAQVAFGSDGEPALVITP